MNQTEDSLDVWDANMKLLDGLLIATKFIAQVFVILLFVAMIATLFELIR